MRKRPFWGVLPALLLALCLFLLPTKAEAATYGDLTYSVSNGKVTITDCNTAATGELVIPDTINNNPVTAIGNSAFRDCTSLTGVSIPNTVTTIGDFAFQSCANMKSVTIGNSVTTIGRDAFIACKGLTNLTIPDSVTAIGYHAFFDCFGLSDVTIGNGVTTISEGVFYGCYSLTSVTIPKSVTTICYDAFFNCSGLTDVHYCGTEAQWSEISIDGRNQWLTTATIHYMARQLTDVAVATVPEKTSYFTGENLDTTGLTLTATYSDGTAETVTEGFTVTGFDPTVTGTQTLTVSYEEFTDTFTVSVREPWVTQLAWSARPAKTIYWAGEALDTTGLALAVTYSDGSTKTVTEGFTVARFDTVKLGAQTLTVSYDSLSVTYTVTVIAPYLTELGVRTEPAKTTYITGEALKTAGLTLSATYSDGNTAAITEGFAVTGFDTSVIGTQTLTVTYEGFTTTFTVTVKEKPQKSEIISQPAAVEITAGYTADFTAEVTNAAAYRWQYRRNENAPWVYTTLPGNRTETLSVQAILARNGYQYRCRITGENGAVLYTDAATLTVNDSIIISQQPTRQVANVDGTAQFAVTASGEGLTYQWLYRKNDEDFWKKTSLSGYNSATLSVSALLTRNGYQYRCAITDENGIKIHSTHASLAVMGFTAQPIGQTVAVNADAVFTLKAEGQSLTYQWLYRKTETGSWMSTSLSGAQTDTLTVKGIPTRNGYQYRCRVTDALGNILYSDTVTLYCGITVHTQPTNQTAGVNDNAVFAVDAIGGGLTYQWQYRKSENGTWLNTSLTGADTDTLTVAALSGRNGYQYRCIITDSLGNTVTTDAATLIVK